MAIRYSIQSNWLTGSYRTVDIFSEDSHPLSIRMQLSNPDLCPSEDDIFNFLRCLFEAAQLTSECAIITLIYLERMVAYTELTILPVNWSRMLLGGILLACKVWDDQAIWNKDFCTVFPDVDVKDM